jgi:hypothetical protein
MYICSKSKRKKMDTKGVVEDEKEESSAFFCRWTVMGVGGKAGRSTFRLATNERSALNSGTGLGSKVSGQH